MAEKDEQIIPDLSGFLQNNDESFIDMDMGEFGFIPDAVVDSISTPPTENEEVIDKEVTDNKDKEGGEGDGDEPKDAPKEDNKKEKKDTDKNEVKETSPTTDTNYNRAFAIAQDLVDEGVLDSFDKEKFKELYDDLGMKAVSEMLKIQQNESLSTVLDEMKTAVEDYYESVYNAPEQKEFFKLLKKGIDFETAKTLFVEKKAYDSVSDRDLEDNDELCQKIIFADYERQGLSEARIKRMWDKIKDDPDAVYEDAVEARNNLKEFATQKEKGAIEAQKQRELDEQKRRDDQKANAEKAREQLNKYVMGLKTVGDIKVTDTDKKKIYSSLTTPVDYVPDPNTGQKRPVFFLETIRNKNPNAFNAALTFYAHKGLFNIDSNGNFKPDFSYFDSKAEKRVKSHLDDVVEKRTVSTSSTDDGKGSSLRSIF